MDGFKADDPRYGRFLRVGEPPMPTEAETERRLRRIGDWLRAGPARPGSARGA